MLKFQTYKVGDTVRVVAGNFYLQSLGIPSDLAQTLAGKTFKVTEIWTDAKSVKVAESLIYWLSPCCVELVERAIKHAVGSMVRITASYADLVDSGISPGIAKHLENFPVVKVTEVLSGSVKVDSSYGYHIPNRMVVPFEEIKPATQAITVTPEMATMQDLYYQTLSLKNQLEKLELPVFELSSTLHNIRARLGAHILKQTKKKD